MYKRKKIIAIVPARGGSKGIKLKNLRKIKKKTLIWHVAKIIKKIKVIDKAIVSTDHPKIAREAIKSGLEVPFVRPKKLSGDKVADVPVLLHALKTYEKKNKMKFDIILMLQPTSPVRKIKDITDCIKILISKRADAVWTVNEIDLKFNPLKQLNIKNNQLFHIIKRGEKIKGRQQLKNTYIRNGVCYAIKRDTFIKYKSLMGKKCIPKIIKNVTSNIDSIKDLKEAEKLFN